MGGERESEKRSTFLPVLATGLAGGRTAVAEHPEAPKATLLAGLYHSTLAAHAPNAIPANALAISNAHRRNSRLARFKLCLISNQIRPRRWVSRRLPGE
jgi:hypothetical protein